MAARVEITYEGVELRELRVNGQVMNDVREVGLKHRYNEPKLLLLEIVCESIQIRELALRADQTTYPV